MKTDNISNKIIVNNSPVFIHSLFRSGSTYLFNVFRRSDKGYWCYQEPLHEMAFYAKKDPEVLQGFFGDNMIHLRHPKMVGGYFKELYETWHEWSSVIDERDIYHNYFPKVGDKQNVDYWITLAKAAKGCPVFQECRTSSRIGTIKQQIGGYHIYLWRNPWDQWWSYKVGNYFDTANQMILNAANPPPVVQELCKAIKFENYPTSDIEVSFDHFYSCPLTSEESYMVFYTLWCLSLKEGQTHANLLLNIDQLTDLPNYQIEVQNHLQNEGVVGIDFLDCHSPQGVYSDEDVIFFKPLEQRVHGLLKLGGWSVEDVYQMQITREKVEPTIWRMNKAKENLHWLEQINLYRSISRRFETDLAKRCSDVNRKNNALETSVEQAEDKAQQAYNQAEQTQAHFTALLHSRSWRITIPLRWLGSQVRLVRYHGIKVRTKSATQKIISYALRHLKRNALFVKFDLYIVRNHSEIRFYIKKLLFNKKNRSVKFSSNKILQKQIQYTYYYYVDHAVSFGANTGLQRVTRMLANSLIEEGKEVKFVKWSDMSNGLVFITLDELEHLEKWNGPKLKPNSKELYNSKESKLERHNYPDWSWLIVPEVTHITNHKNSLTEIIINEAKSLNLKSAFIFYDDIPKYREELKHVRSTHNDYMRALYESDIILSISEWSNKDLIDFTKQYVQEEIKKNWAVTLPLPSESILSPRIIQNTTTDKTILCVGSITKHKNQLTLVKAFNSYCEKNINTDWALIIAGNAMPDVALKINKIISENSRIKLLTDVGDEQLKEIYTKCAFTVFPSIVEGFGLPIVESLWFGKPCICANFGAMSELSVLPGCIAVDTKSEIEVENAISKLIEEPAFLNQKYSQVYEAKLSTWKDYAQSFIKKIEDHDINDISHESIVVPKMKRVFWLGAHKILVNTELPRLKKMGYEVYYPPYLSNIKDQSVVLEWDNYQQTSLPKEIFYKLSKHNFFYNDIPDEIGKILNTYFGTIVVTCSPAWLEPIIKKYNGKVIFRTYGQPYIMSNSLSTMSLQTYIEESDFTYIPFCKESIVNEAPWILKKATIVPYCVNEKFMKHKDTWDMKNASSEIALSCPNISNEYYFNHYKYLKENFSDKLYKYYGVQTTNINDDNIVGTLTRETQIKRLRKSSGYLYTYSDKVCYMPPIEMMIIGGPVLFMAGSLLDDFFPKDAPGRCSIIDEAKKKVNLLLEKNEDFIQALISSQENIRKRYIPSYVWESFDKTFAKIIG